MVSDYFRYGGGAGGGKIHATCLEVTFVVVGTSALARRGRYYYM